MLDKILVPVKIDVVSAICFAAAQVTNPQLETPVGPSSPLGTILVPVKMDDVFELRPV